VRPLVPVRRAAPFDASFPARSPHFWPLARALAALGPGGDFPAVADLGRVFAEQPPVAFVRAAPRRRRAPLDPRALYDARITLDFEVPTRERCWHDFMNALVWGTFPRAKRALHARQHRAIAARLAPGARTLPPVRTRELDALALLDEGGVVLLPGRAAPIVFGHAIYESLALGVAPAIVAAVEVPEGVATRGARDASAASDVGRADGALAAVVEGADRALAAIVEDDTRLTAPAELRRVDLTSTSPRAWATDAPSDESVRPLAS
jgi:hypothetical protein